MGLDNGILKGRRGQKEWDFNTDEVCYWRKCYNVRSMILDIVSTHDNCYGYYFPINADQIDFIIEGLEKLISSKEEWERAGYSIWDYDENNVVENNKEQINALKAVKQEMLNDPEIELVFYDSY